MNKKCKYSYSGEHTYIPNGNKNKCVHCGKETIIKLPRMTKY